MAPLNPNVPDVNPANTAFWARPIEQPKADESGKTLYAGIGRSFDEAVSGVDDFIKHGVIQPIEEKDLGGMRNEFADALNTARTAIDHPSSEGDKSTLLPSGQNVPTAVAQVGNKLETLQSSMEGGHLSESDYYGRVDNYLRRLRTMFPGYIDYIDQEGARITGVHGANAYIRSQISDLNRLMSAHQGKKDEIQSELEWAARDGAITPDVFDDFQRRARANPGDTGLRDEIRSYINKARQYVTNNKIAEGDYKRSEENKKQADEKAKIGLNQAFSQERDKLLDHYEIASGLYKGANLKSWLHDLDQGLIDTKNPQFTASLTQTATELQGAIDQMKASFKQYAMRSYPGYGGAGDQSLDNIIKSNIQPLQDMVDHLHKGDVSWFSVNADMTKGMRADRDRTLEEKYGEQAASLRFLKEVGAMSMIPTGMYKDIGDFDEKVYKTDWLKARAQPGLLPGGDGQVMTWNKAMEDWKSKAATKENYDTLIGWRDDLLNKDTPAPVKESLVKFFYSVDNWRNFSKYNFKEPNDVYNRLFNELMSKNISKLPTENYQWYRGAAEAEGSALFRGDMLTLKGFERGGAGDAVFNWHTEPYMQKNGKRGMLELVGARPSATMQKAVENLNDLFMGVKSVYDHDPQHKGTQVEEFVAHMMQEYGIDPTHNINGMPEKVMSAVMAARKPKQSVTPGEETGKVKTLEEK